MKKVIFVIIMLLIIVGVVYFCINGTNQIVDLFYRVEVKREANDFGGETLTKEGSNATIEKEYPEEYIPVMEKSVAQNYKVAKDGENNVVNAEATFYVEKGFNEIKEYYQNYYAEYEEYNLGKSENTLVNIETDTINCKKDDYHITVKIESPSAASKDTCKVILELQREDTQG